MSEKTGPRRPDDARGAGLRQLIARASTIVIHMDNTGAVSCGLDGLRVALLDAAEIDMVFAAIRARWVTSEEGEQ